MEVASVQTAPQSRAHPIQLRRVMELELIIWQAKKVTLQLRQLFILTWTLILVNIYIG